MQVQLAGMSDQVTGIVTAVKRGLPAELLTFSDHLCDAVDVLNREISSFVCTVVFVQCRLLVIML